jgi:hypothetical protein
MAMTSMLRLANSGNNMEFVDSAGNRNIQAEKEWREFASRVNAISNEGLDGLINQLHKSALLFGGMACEVVVQPNLRDIEDIYTILPQSIEWEVDKITGKWTPWQYNGTQKVDLSKGNFFWVSFDADIGMPTGTLMYESALQAIDYQLQFYSDTAAVLRRVGYPRNDLSIERKAVIESAPTDIKNDTKKLTKYLQEYYESIKLIMSGLEPTDDLLHFDDIKLGTGSAGGDNSRTIDLRAYNEMIDPQVLNGLSCLAILANRTTGITESWGTVQFKIVTQTIQGLQRGSKRLIESIAKIWLQVHGYNLAPHFSHNPVDWDSEEKRLDCKLKTLQVNRRAEEYGYVDKKTAAANAMGVSELPTNSNVPNDLFEYVKSVKTNTNNQSNEGD